MREKLHRASRYVLADAYFTKNNFVTGLHEMKFDPVRRFRDDAALYYPTLQKPIGKKGRPKIYDGRVDMTSLDTTRVQKINIDNGDFYTIVVYSKSLKQMVRFVIWYSKEGAKAEAILLYRSGNEWERCHRILPQTFSDQVLLQECQRLHRTNAVAGKGHCKAIFNFNASLTSVNLVKVL